MTSEFTLTSDMWQVIYTNPRIVDPDGWDRENFEYSWYIEEITLEEYAERALWSTCMSDTNEPTVWDYLEEINERTVESE